MPDPQLGSVRRTSINHQKRSRRMLPLRRRAQIIHALGNILLAISTDVLLNKNKL
jgi:hypothetical protein